LGLEKIELNKNIFCTEWVRFLRKVMLFWAGVLKNIPNRRVCKNGFIILLLAIDFYGRVKVKNNFPLKLFINLHYTEKKLIKR